MRESVARLQLVRGMLNEALEHLDYGMVSMDEDGYEALTRARERLLTALRELVTVERAIAKEVRGQK